MNLASRKVGVLAVLSAVAIVAISFMKAAMELEDAEQAYYSQWWRWGYDDQPPLYTWLQLLVNSIFGVSKFSFSFLRALLFSSTLIVLYRFGRIYLKRKQLALLALLLLVLVPSFVDFTFRRLSHTTLLLLTVVTTFIVLTRLIRVKSILNYTLLGAIVGLGILTKYNYFLFLAAIFMLVFFDNEFRKVLLNWKIIISLLVTAIIVFPHVMWLVNHNEYVSELTRSVAIKTLKSKEGVFILSPLLAFVASFFKLILPLLVVVVTLILIKKIKWVNVNKTDWLVKLFWIQVVVLAMTFTVLNIQKVETRWLLPLFFPFVILLLSKLKIDDNPKFTKPFYYCFLAVLLIQTLRTPVEKMLRIPSSVHFGFYSISDKLNIKYKNNTWVLPNVTYAGNIRILNPDREIYAMDDYSLPKNTIDTTNTVFISIKNTNLFLKKEAQDSILDFGLEKDDLFFLKQEN